jgi:hypothetical protein
LLSSEKLGARKFDWGNSRIELGRRENNSDMDSPFALKTFQFRASIQLA